MSSHAIRRWGSSLCVIIAGAATVLAAMQYPFGTLAAMGPGYFPVALGVLLIFLGALLGLAPDDAAAEDAAAPRTELRGPVLVVVALVLFIIIGKYAGLAPAAFVLIFLSALGDRGTTLRSAAVLAAVVTSAGLFLFAKVLHGQLPLFIWN